MWKPNGHRCGLDPLRHAHFQARSGTGRAVLNGKPYFMRGSNITLYRFFEDSECGNLPWRDWVRTFTSA